MTTTLTDRITKAQTIARYGLATVLDADAKGTVKTVAVPGTDAKSYQVILRRENGAITTECLLNTGAGTQACKGNGNGICYHSMTAVIMAASKSGGKLTLHSTTANARKSGGLLVKITSRQSGKSIFGSYKSEAK